MDEIKPQLKSILKFTDGKMCLSFEDDHKTTSLSITLLHLKQKKGNSNNWSKFCGNKDFTLANLGTLVD